MKKALKKVNLDLERKAGATQEKEKIYIDLMKIADDCELEDMRREIIRYFTNN